MPAKKKSRAASRLVLKSEICKALMSKRSRWVFVRNELEEMAGFVAAHLSRKMAAGA